VILIYVTARFGWTVLAALTADRQTCLSVSVCWGAGEVVPCVPAVGVGVRAYHLISAPSNTEAQPHCSFIFRLTRAPSPTTAAGPPARSSSFTHTPTRRHHYNKNKKGGRARRRTAPQPIWPKCWRPKPKLAPEEWRASGPGGWVSPKARGRWF